MKVLWFMVAGIVLGHLFAVFAPVPVATAVESGIRVRYEKSYEIAQPVMPEPSPTQWAFLNNVVVLFVMAYGGLLLTYVNFGPTWENFYKLMARLDGAYKKCDYKDELFSLQLMPYGGSFINGLLVGYIARKADVALLGHVPLELLGLLLAGLIGEKFEKTLRGRSKLGFTRTRSSIVQSLKYWHYWLMSVCLIALSAALEFS